MSKTIEETKPGEKGFCSVCDGQYFNYQAFSTFICIDCFKKGFRIKTEKRIRMIFQLKKETRATEEEKSPCQARQKIAKGVYRCNIEQRYFVHCAYTDHASREIKECYEIHKKEMRN